jgi:penicillin-binding protein 1A
MGRQTFYPLPDYLADKVNCEDFSMEDPDLGFFQRLFGKKTERPDSTNLKIDENKKEEQRKSLLDKMKDLFKKK